MVVSCLEASIEAVQNRQNDVAELVDRKLAEVPVDLVEVESMSLSDTKSQVHKLLVTRYPADLE